MKLRGKKAVAAGMAIALCVSAMEIPASANTRVTKVTLNKSKVTLYEGADSSKSSVTLKAKVKPASAAQVKWATSAKKVATVSAKGVVKAKKAGKATVTATAGSRKASCKVTVKKVKKKVKSIEVSPDTVSLKKGSSVKLSVSVSPAKATIREVAFKSGNTKVATVTKEGKVKGVKAGTAKITVSALDGSKVNAKVTVKVTSGNSKPTAKPTEEPGTDPTKEPGADPTEKPGTDPTLKPSQSPSSGPVIIPPVQTPAPGQTTTPDPSETPEPSATPDLGEYEYEVEANEDGSYTLLDGEDYIIRDGDDSIVVDQGTIAKCSSAIAKFNTGVDIVSLWDSYAGKLSASNAEVTVKKDGVQAVLSERDGQVTADITVSGQNPLLDSSYTVVKEGDAFLVTGGLFNSAVAAQSGGTFSMSDIVWSPDTPSILLLAGDYASMDPEEGRVSGEDISVVFAGGTVRIIGLPEDAKVYSKQEQGA